MEWPPAVGMLRLPMPGHADDTDHRTGRRNPNMSDHKIPTAAAIESQLLESS